MEEDKNVLIEISGNIAKLTINRPEKLNALNHATRSELMDLLDDLAVSDDTRVAIITGAGEKAFIAGADISEFEGRTAVDQYEAMSGRNVFEAVEAFPKPLIAALNGFCLGGGCELAMACDIRIASEKARLGQPEVNLGLLPGGGGTQRLPRLVGLGRALKLMYTGEIISAAEAYEIGLVDEVVAPEKLNDRVAELAAEIAKKSPVALRLIKRSAQASTRTTLDEGLQQEKALFGIAFASEDKAEGVAAFLEKRPANFKGR